MRLTDDKLEKLLWRLEVANAEANDRVLSAASEFSLPAYSQQCSMLIRVRMSVSLTTHVFIPCKRTCLAGTECMFCQSLVNA